MATLQELDIALIDQTIASAVRRHVPVILTVHSGDRWINLHSRFLVVGDGRLLLEMPLGEDDQSTHEFAPADKVGVSFKLKHYKHVFTAVVAGFAEMRTEDGVEHTALSICSPSKMQRIQRRVFLRAPVPPNRIVRATFWLGGREAEPAGGSSDRPIWFGKVANISAGGFQLRTDGYATQMIEVGESVGVRLSFGAGADETVFADAQFRHVEQGQDGVLMGFQFIGLDQTPQGQQALGLISSKVGEYQRIFDRSHREQPLAPAVPPACAQSVDL